jgi:hypothetical protein
MSQARYTLSVVRALFLRFYRFTGPVGIYILLFGGIACPLVFAIAGPGPLVNSAGPAITFFLMSCGAVVAMVMGGTKYRRSAATQPYEQLLIPLVQSDEEFCLVLRPFGSDGQVILPKTRKKKNGDGRLAGRGAFIQNVTMEQVVATAVRAALGLRTYAVVDQSVAVAPPGLTFMRVPNDAWKGVADRLIRRAHSIVLIVPPGGAIGTGFAWEIEQIVHYAMQARVLIVLPTDEAALGPDRDALRTATDLLVLLEDSDARADQARTAAHQEELPLPDNTLVVKCYVYACDARTCGVVRRTAPPSGRRAKRQLRLEARRKLGVGDDVYGSCLRFALEATESELSEWGFDSRYPWDSHERRVPASSPGATD